MKWYGLFVKTGEEENLQKMIELLMNTEELTTLVPKRKIIERHQGITTKKIKKLFPGYILVNVRMNIDTYYDLIKLPGVYQFLRDGYDPIPIREEEMELILALTREGETIDFSTVYREGDKIRVVNGPLKDLEGIIESYDRRKKRIRVCLDFLGERRKVDLGSHMITDMELDRAL